MDVNSSGQAEVRAVTRSELHEASENGNAFGITSSYTTSGGDEEVLYIKNTSATQSLEIHSVVVGSAVNAVFTLYEVTGTAGGASAITVAPLKMGITANYAISATGDAAVTGLTLGNVIFKLRILAGYSDIFDFQGAITMPPGTAVALSNSATGAFEATVLGHLLNHS